MNSVIEAEVVQNRELESIPFPCCIVRADGSVVHANSMGFALLQRGESTLGASLHPDDAYALATSLWSAREAFELDCRLRTDEGRFHWFQLRATPDHAAHWLCCFIDIDARKSREAHLHHELKIRDDMLNASVDCIKVIAPDGALTHMNRTGCDALGVQTDSGFGMAWLALLPEAVQPAGLIALKSAQRGENARRRQQPVAGRSAALLGQRAHAAERRRWSRQRHSVRIARYHFATRSGTAPSPCHSRNG